MRSSPVRTSREILDWTAALIEPRLRAAVDGFSDELRLVSGFHFGWWDEHGNHTDGNSGKALRPAFVLLTAQASGGDAQDAIAGAVAIELVHNHSLLHDDVMDGDVLRRGRPTAWSALGIGPAILGGDVLIACSIGVLASADTIWALDAVRLLNRATHALIYGQGADLDFETRDDVGLAECLAMAKGKTGALFGCACGLGALLVGRPAAQVEAMYGFGERLGLAFQLVDDILGIWGDPAVTGKPASSDLANRKKSLPVVAALTSDTAAARELGALYAQTGPLGPAEIDRARELVDDTGARAWATTEADRQRAYALEQLDDADLHGPAAAELGELADLVTTRAR